MEETPEESPSHAGTAQVCQNTVANIEQSEYGLWLVLVLQTILRLLLSPIPQQRLPPTDCCTDVLAMHTHYQLPLGRCP